MGFQESSLVRNKGICCTVGFIEPIASKFFNQVKYFFGFVLINSFVNRALNESVSMRFKYFQFFLAHGFSKVIGFCHGIPGEKRLKDGDIINIDITVIVFNNFVYGETGGQMGHTAIRTDLARIAEGAGLPSVMTIRRPEEIAAAAKFLVEAAAPRFLLARVRPGPPTAYKRDLDPAACRLRFRDAYLGAG